MPFADLGSFAIISLLLAIVSIRTLYQTIRDRKQLFDHRFTTSDRQHMSTVAFFLLIPISVLLHEAGHAVAVWAFGGEVLTFGFFLFFGFVEHQGFYTANDLFWIALSGNAVSIVLGLGALAYVFSRPKRAAVNYLLIMFGLISLLVSLVFYPMTDMLSGLHGDWSQIYTWDTTELSIGMGVIHAVILLGLVIGWRTSRVRLRYAELTDLRPEEVRKVGRSDLESELHQAAMAAAEQFHGLAAVESNSSSREVVSVRIVWTSNGYHRTLVVAGVLSGQSRIELLGAVRVLNGSNDAGQQPVMRIRGLPGPDETTPRILRALQTVDTWTLARESESEQA